MKRLDIGLIALGACLYAYALEQQEPEIGAKRQAQELEVSTKRTRRETPRSLHHALREREMGNRDWRRMLPKSHLADIFDMNQRYEEEFIALNPISRFPQPRQEPSWPAEDKSMIDVIGTFCAYIDDEVMMDRAHEQYRAEVTRKYAFKRLRNGDNFIQVLCALDEYEQQKLLLSEKLARFNGVVMQMYRDVNTMIDYELPLGELRNRLAQDLRDVEQYCPKNTFLRNFFLGQLQRLAEPEDL